MKLISLEIIGKGLTGWHSNELSFGEHITHLLGPNGCGKTPVVQSIAFCLGFPCIFRDDIYKHCHFAQLKIEDGDRSVIIKRKIDRDVDIEVIDSKEGNQFFYSEDEFSDYLFELLNLERNQILSTRNKATKAYLSTLLPFVYLDQDDGYRSHYYTKSNFIKDQFEEMVRVLFSLPPKNAFNKKKQKIDEKQRLEYLDKAVNFRFKAYSSQREKVSNLTISSQEIYEEVRQLEEELDNLKNSYSNHDDSINALDKIIASHRKSIRNIDMEIQELTFRNHGLGKIISEINTEIETLNLNEEARRVFLASREICGSSNCKLFSKSSDGYSKNLLYLKDQIKDLQRNSENDDLKIDELKRKKIMIEELVSDIVSERNEAINKSEASVLVDTISEIKNQLFDLQSQHDQLEQLDKLEEHYFNVKKERDIALDRYNSLSSSRQSIPDLIRLKSRFKELLIKWLTAIRTKNVNLDIKWKGDFVPLFGTETIEQIKGSTRARVVIAYHAALLELLLEQENNKIKFIIFDTPKQHEIHDDDLDNFMKEMKKLSTKYSLQIIFSTTEYKYRGDDYDIRWVPMFPGVEQNMFLTKK